MCAISEKLVDNSLAAVLSAIEIYNKPDFKYREEIFTILLVNAWELLLKAKILKDADDKIESLYVLDSNVGGYKKNRNGTPLTIEINGAMNKTGLAQTVLSNIKFLVDIRDTAVHFYHDDSLSYLLYTLGAASLQNYQKIIADWFNKSLLDYNFYILPLGFAYNFKTLSLLEFEKEPEIISDLIKAVIDTQSSFEELDDFYFTCEIATVIRKKVQYTTEQVDLSVSIDPTMKENIMVERLVNITDQYPFSFREVCERVKKERPYAKSNKIYEIIRDYDMKNNPKYSQYNFMTKKHKEKYNQTKKLPAGAVSLYNDNAVRFIIAQISSVQMQFRYEQTETYREQSQDK